MFISFQIHLMSSSIRTWKSKISLDQNKYQIFFFMYSSVSNLCVCTSLRKDTILYVGHVDVYNSISRITSPLSYSIGSGCKVKAGYCSLIAAEAVEISQISYLLKCLWTRVMRKRVCVPA